MGTPKKQPWAPIILPKSPKLGQALGVKGNIIIPTAVSAAIGFVGFRLGSQDHGIPSTLGYIVGGLGALGAILGVLSMIGVRVLPSPITLGSRKQ